ncbi:hypothetical protein GobsT_14700 [Gemmata obscuriglobus]|nr:hypothetical protein GobsT_14700 [Gemmata obscuriglobus]VTS02462.1 Uncharacterized protein OS=Singulisphaera acidiphila (strain ATCC BAA-1392 / DSM 18658 / VKM B-2454 / MOB10) GN=Sinac_2189 PE=4 SV=1 [Gemmata obscuriglobus UQM 2246]
MRTGLRRIGRGAVVAFPLALAACQTLIKPAPCVDGVEGGDCPKAVFAPRVLHNPTVLTAAGDLDHVEKHIDWHGSVVPKVPDVWGQARLTLYREQFEQEMLKELGQFKEALQGSVARSDQAFALSTTALGLRSEQQKIKRRNCCRLV